MPYISMEARDELDDDIDRLADKLNLRGEFNYTITRMIHHYILRNGKRYDTLNDAVGILQCAQLELYRSIIGPYEDTKIETNGKVGIVDG